MHCVSLFFDSFQNYKGDLNYFSYNAFKHVINLCLNDFGILGFRFLEEKLRTTHEIISDLQTKPYRLYEFLNNNSSLFMAKLIYILRFNKRAFPVYNHNRVAFKLCPESLKNYY